MHEPIFAPVEGRFEARTVLVTGGASGFGLATVRRFHAEGANVVIADIDADRAFEVACTLGERAIGIPVDVTESTAVAEMINKTCDRFGGLDVLVNNAGRIHTKRPVDEIPVAEFESVFDVNVRGTFLGIKHASPALRKSRRGVILNMASVGALVPRRWSAAYTASKMAIIGLTKAAALDLAPAIRVNAVCPLAADTPFLTGGAGSAVERSAYLARLREDAVQNTPMGRLALADDVAAAFAFLASDDASLITGVALPLDGGRSAGDASTRIAAADQTD